MGYNVLNKYEVVFWAQQALDEKGLLLGRKFTRQELKLLSDEQMVLLHTEMWRCLIPVWEEHLRRYSAKEITEVQFQDLQAKLKKVRRSMDTFSKKVAGDPP